MKPGFVRPPEAPVFRPSEAEFLHPLEYIASIRAAAEPYGICKIIPPASWHAPFCLSWNKFEFHTRLQRLNELDGLSRVRLNFVEAVMKLCDLNGIPLKSLPVVASRNVDVFRLYRLVRERGGYVAMCKDRLWSAVSELLGYDLKKKEDMRAPSLLRSIYCKYLFAYEIIDRKAKGEVTAEEAVRIRSVEASPYKTRQSAPRASPSSDEMDDESSRGTQYESSTEHAAKRRLHADDEHETGKSKNKKLAVGDESPTKHDANNYCAVCNALGDAESLICFGCYKLYHARCVYTTVPPSRRLEWMCHNCVETVAGIKHGGEAYGFTFVERKYTLTSFKKKADKFFQDYFQQPAPLSTETVEAEFWRMLSSTEDLPDAFQEVEYGADLHSALHGSGFPGGPKSTGTIVPEHIDSKTKEFLDNGWDLNKTATADLSLLRHIRANISGMMVPWVYVGMCFSTFCWHNEDHWSYSINYNHYGAVKTWYGIPGAEAEAFERTMRASVPELFHSNPQLLYQLTTMLSPAVLMEQNVPVYRLDQSPGEFVVTFPRAYHAGFNQGFNVAEAVNFAPPDWLPLGRLSVETYRKDSRSLVFSHDELLCLVAKDASSAHVSIVQSVADQFRTLMSDIKQCKHLVSTFGITQTAQFEFETIVDEERVCAMCNRTCFTLAVACPCQPKKCFCVEHVVHDVVKAEDGHPHSLNHHHHHHHHHPHHQPNQKPKQNSAPPQHSLISRMGGMKPSTNSGRMRSIVEGNASIANTPSHISSTLCEKCPRSTWTLLYRYTDEEMEGMLESLNRRAQDVRLWIEKGETVVRNGKMTLAQLDELIASSNCLPRWEQDVRDLLVEIKSARDLLVQSETLFPHARPLDMDSSESVEEQLLSDINAKYDAKPLNTVAQIAAWTSAVQNHSANFGKLAEKALDITKSVSELQDLLGSLLETSREHYQQTIVEHTEALLMHGKLHHAREELQRIGVAVDEGPKLYEELRIWAWIAFAQICLRQLEQNGENTTSAELLHVGLLLNMHMPAATRPVMTSLTTQLSAVLHNHLGPSCEKLLQSRLVPISVGMQLLQLARQQAICNPVVGSLEKALQFAATLESHASSVCFGKTGPKPSLAQAQLWRAQMNSQPFIIDHYSLLFKHISEMESWSLQVQEFVERFGVQDQANPEAFAELWRNVNSLFINSGGLRLATSNVIAELLDCRNRLKQVRPVSL